MSGDLSARLAALGCGVDAQYGPLDPEAWADPRWHDYAARFLVERLAGHGAEVWARFVPTDCGAWSREALDKLCCADRIRHDDELAKRLRLAAVHLAGLEQATTWAEQLSSQPTSLNPSASGTSAPGDLT